MSTPRPQSWPDAIVFDLDGTLIDSAPDIARALNITMERRSLEPFSLHEVKQMVGGGVLKMLERALAARGLPAEGAGPIVSDYVEIYAADATRETTLYPGAEDQLALLAAAGVRIGLCTNKVEFISIKILQDLGVARYFSAVIGGRDDLPRKPHPAPLQAALARLGAAGRRALMVGDSAADAGAAQALGVPIALVSFGYSKTPVHELGADAVIDALADLPGAIAAIGFGGTEATAQCP